MKKYVFLTCDDLTDFVDDDALAFKAFNKIMPKSTYDLVSWSKPGIDWSIYDYAIVRTTWDYTKRLSEFLTVLEQIESSGCKLLNSKSVINWNTKKTYLKDLKEKGISIIDSIFLEDENIESFKKNIEALSLNETFVIKPVVGASADDIKVLSKEEMIKEFLALKNKSDWFVQPFIKEVLNGELSFFFFNGDFSHAVKKVPKDGDFRVQEEHGGEISLYSASQEEIEKTKSVVSSVIDYLGEQLLYARVDMLNTPEGLKLIELELVEPSLYFRCDPESGKRFMKALSTH